MERRECETRYELAAAILPSRLRRIAMELPETDKRRAEEFRLRAGHCLSVLLPEGERSLEAIVTTEELETLCDIAAEFSRYASIETLRQGFLPVRGGFRVGLCGSAVVKDGEVTNLKQISSAVIRISREQKGIAQAVAPRLFRDGRFVSTLLLSPPGGGKTTLLRDLVRQLSQGEGVPPQRITLIDEREEIAVMYRGQPQMDVGPRTDVLSGCPKALAIPMALRAMIRRLSPWTRSPSGRICEPSRRRRAAAWRCWPPSTPPTWRSYRPSPCIRNCWPGGCSVRRC